MCLVDGMQENLEAEVTLQEELLEAVAGGVMSGGESVREGGDVVRKGGGSGKMEGSEVKEGVEKSAVKERSGELGNRILIERGMWKHERGVVGNCEGNV